METPVMMEFPLGAGGTQTMHIYKIILNMSVVINAMTKTCKGTGLENSTLEMVFRVYSPRNDIWAEGGMKWRSKTSRLLDTWEKRFQTHRNSWTELILCLRRAWYLLGITIFLNFPKQLTKKVEEQLCCLADKIVFSLKLEWSWHRMGYTWGHIWVSWSPKLKWFWRTYLRVNDLFS